MMNDPKVRGYLAALEKFLAPLSEQQRQQVMATERQKLEEKLKNSLGPVHKVLDQLEHPRKSTASAHGIFERG